MENQIQWHLETRRISELRPYFKNPRILTKDQEKHLRTSLDKFGVVDRPCINLDGTIIGGHQRINVMGVKSTEIEVMVPSRALSDREVEELNIRLNKNIGDWDWDILANQWEIEDLINWGFDPKEMSISSPQEGINDEVEEPILSPPVDPITKPGDLYEFNEHRLICGDSTSSTVVSRLLEGVQSLPILMVTDPSYGVDYNPIWRKNIGKAHGMVKAGGKVQNDERVDWKAAWDLFPGTVAYVWHAGKFASEVQSSLERANFTIISQIIWAKQHFALSRGDYHWQHEPCWYAVKKGCEHNWQGSRKESTLWEVSNLNAFGKNEEDERTAHGTQKPIECMARPIRNNSGEGDAVYDPFLGSGTTLLAAQSLLRTCYGAEIDPAYCDIILQRWVSYMKIRDLEFTVKRNGEQLVF